MRVHDFFDSRLDAVRSRMDALGRPFHCVEMVELIGSGACAIAQRAGLCGPEVDLLRVAALYCDLGFELSERDSHANSRRLFEADAIGLISVAEIECVSALIMSMAVPQNPRTRMQAVAADAYLSYIVLDDYWKWSERRREEEERPDGWSWWDAQNRFLYTHRFHTDFMRAKQHVVDGIRAELGRKQRGG